MLSKLQPGLRVEMKLERGELPGEIIQVISHTKPRVTIACVTTATEGCREIGVLANWDGQKISQILIGKLKLLIA